MDRQPRPDLVTVLASLPAFCGLCGGAHELEARPRGGTGELLVIPCPHCGPQRIPLLYRIPRPER